ncbi:hypothetical protein JCGZ_01201 [Jatropha curcas]|uniref:Autophagy-related protein 27 n=2 Tax=Jatropha curcas TaxID=180498 RepID=A0A067L8E1_JATCU|nr:hypothetical protein JCGZ_01201 [Jatropha curcas]
MAVGINSLKCFLFTAIAILHLVGSLNSVTAVCDLSFVDGNKLYNFSLASPLPNFPHGVLSEDGFYKVAANESVLWFQLCDGMIFNHDPPTCVDCLDCGGPLRCGMKCSALVAKNKGGYDVCSTIGHVSSTSTSVIDKQKPHKGIIVKMSNIVKMPNGSNQSCSLSVSILCDSNGAKGPESLEKLGTCDYATVMQHPSGCAMVVSVHGNGWGWFVTLLIIILCLFGGYMLVGAAYRYFFLGIRGLDMIPNLDIWARLPQRTQSFFASLVRKFRGPTEGYRSSYSPVNF